MNVQRFAGENETFQKFAAQMQENEQRMKQRQNEAMQMHMNNALVTLQPLKDVYLITDDDGGCLNAYQASTDHPGRSTTLRCHLYLIQHGYQLNQHVGQGSQRC